MGRRPGGEVSSRPLHFIWIADCSGSMSIDGKMEGLNKAVRESIPHMQKAAKENPEAEVLVRTVQFSSGAQWHTSSQATSIQDFQWEDLSASGLTDMGKALSMVAEQLKIPPMSDRALHPVLVLISDGQPTDDFEQGLKELMELPWGKKAVRIAIAIGKDAYHDVLEKFVNNPEVPVLQANNTETLTDYIRWVSTAVLKSVSSPVSQTKDLSSPAAKVQIPTLNNSGNSSANDVW